MPSDEDASTEASKGEEQGEEERDWLHRSGTDGVSLGQSRTAQSEKAEVETTFFRCCLIFLCFEPAKRVL